jgi:hypothetical protein
MSFTDIWDSTFENKPDDNNYVYEVDNYIRRVQLAVRERMQVDHIWMIGNTDGGHNKLSLAIQTGKPTAAAGYGFVYTKDIGGGVVELFWEDALGNEKQMTSGGRLTASFDPIINSDIFDKYANEDYASKNLDLLSNPSEWKLFYVGKYGEIIELALGSTAGVPLVSNGAALAPSFSPVANAAIGTGAIGTVNIVDEAVTPAKLSKQIIAGTTFTLASAPTERTTLSTSYVKLKEVLMNFGGTATVTFSMYGGGGNNYGKIYRNDAPVGTERTSVSTDPIAYSEPITFAAGDKIQIYAKTGYSTSISTLLIQCGENRATVTTD